MKLKAVVPVFPSGPLKPEMLMLGSSFRMVPIPKPSATKALVASLRRKRKASVCSPTRSPITGTETVISVWPWAKVSRPEVDW